MAPTKKNSKNAYLADQEPTGAEIPPELNVDFSNPEEKESSPKRRGRPKRAKEESAEAKVDAKSEKEPVEKVVENKEEKSFAEAPVEKAPAAEKAPALQPDHLPPPGRRRAAQSRGRSALPPFPVSGAPGGAAEIRARGAAPSGGRLL